MKIQYPPIEASRHFYTKIANHVLELKAYFKDKDFDDIYYSQFEWFRGELPCTDKVLSLGCGYGREAFALMWNMKAVEAIGIDIDYKRVEHATKRSQDIREFSEIMQQALAEIDSGQFRAWCESVPTELIDCIIPRFSQGDISDNLVESTSRPDGYFDLVYCCNVLYFIADESRDKLYLALQNIARTVKAETGRIVIVEPTIKNGTQYDFRTYFEQVGLTLAKEPPEHEGRLGYLKMPGTKPMGYILKRKVSE